jgi:hypothetical protein
MLLEICCKANVDLNTPWQTAVNFKIPKNCVVASGYIVACPFGWSSSLGTKIKIKLLSVSFAFIFVSRLGVRTGLKTGCFKQQLKKHNDYLYDMRHTTYNV